MQQVQRVVRAEVRRSYKGPIPDPETLRGYEAVQAGFAERIMAMAEREQEHRHGMDTLDANQAFRLASRGQTFALIALAIMASLAITLALMEEPAWAAVVGGIDVAAVVGVFITGRRSSTEETNSGETSTGRSALPAASQEGEGSDDPAS
ncbi:DUF2335 domain-containing protein [Streptomyces murinus]|uniref:DUF2335 domain-containing protein n=1 Tax=Streptomyces murinus TaxID=33900 RepID=UPI0033D6564B